MFADSPRLPSRPSVACAPPSVRRGALERMPKWAICVPIVFQWAWLALRHASVTLPTAANPRITAGGLVGEGKLEYFDQMGPRARAATARHAGIRDAHGWSDAAWQQALEAARLSFPLVAKPDLGLCGYGVRKLDSLDALRAYAAAYPAGETFVLQEYLDDEGEAGVFYARDPASGAGRLIGLALRYYPRVLGDGVATLGQLIAGDARAARVLGSKAHASALDLDAVPASGQVVRLSTIGSTRVGGLYRDGASLVTPELTAAIDAIARDMPEFHFGRFDVRFSSESELAAGRGFTIMEVNGAGSEAIQAWDPDIGLAQGLRMVFAKQRVVFAIGAANRRRGVRPIGPLALIRLNWRQNALIDQYPPSN
ncbi:hypothetical protein Q4S45_10950 [Massilia sp. R2A-15]|uniref:hypothetical protein n=1 Tax=Massilia sp. R2A-15 TaxID=3064278 RepID=UPI00273733BE|nr:hypothetical protein [Massilia sp. R2A-15]WLI91608.1 hypothetical protein Q4S45_10950 [Massilia sp. R2A-15]